ncbi:uncharacterized protein LOC123197423 [Mangifera indica]|uniref:uncharacterized protein LOC123197423 n=1 Tax=Mangifera indica TaxID=29780 RepID=UPI001CFA732D|nr:uncharacterized protein LOC123197423 [Mangifera indica]
MMGRFCFSRVLLLSVLLALFFSHGFGRLLMETAEFEDSTVEFEEAEIGGETRELIELMDYKPTGPNTNPKTGYIFSPPSLG